MSMASTSNNYKHVSLCDDRDGVLNVEGLMHGVGTDIDWEHIEYDCHDYDSTKCVYVCTDVKPRHSLAILVFRRMGLFALM